MGLNFSYLLYFKREHLWDVLKGLGEMAEVYDHPHTIIHFPDHDLTIPIMTAFWKKSELQHDDPEFSFATSLLFDEDEAILEYLKDRGDDEYDRSPPGEDTVDQIAIGFIYLTVYAELMGHFSYEKPTDLVLFDFGTTGTRMSMLFQDSTSIRKAFIGLLEKFQGVCGIFNREIDGGELFWLKGRQLREDILSVYMPPDEIEEMLERGW